MLDADGKITTIKTISTGIGNTNIDSGSDTIGYKTKLIDTPAEPKNNITKTW